MKVQKIQDYVKGDNTPTYVKYGLIAAGLYLGYKVIQLFTPAAPAVDQAKNELEQLMAKGIKPSYPDSMYSQWSNAITSAGFNTFGTDEQTIYDIFKKMNNNADIAKLIIAFGEQRVEFSLQSVALGAWLSSELNSSEMAVINKILSDKKITYKF
jgi:hypothetical protein